MKRHSFLLSLFGFIVCFIASCKKDGLKTYTGGDNIFFDNVDIFSYAIDSSIVTFAYNDSSIIDKLVRIKVKVSGSPSAQDRPFKLMIDPSSTAVPGQHYENLPELFMLSAGKVEDTIAVKLLRAADLKQKQVKLAMLLLSNETFTTNIKTVGAGQDGKPISSLQFKILFSDILIEPAGWWYYFGKFSAKKMGIICQLAGIEAEWLNAGTPDEPLNSPKFQTKTIYYAQLLNEYLLRMKYAGTPVLYEDGTEMRTDDY